ncbi:two-component sensor histidine kinase (plasmid) [Chondrocystis sp. NIES-4102]|nr:two-component sensor histidine kinase [Chondrocystis sp. NIES-4102]
MRPSKLFGKSHASLALWYAGVMGLILSLLGVVGYKAIARAYRVDIDKDLQSIAGTLHQSLELQLKQPEQIEPLVEQLLPNLCLAGNSCSPVKLSSPSHHNLSAINQGSYYVRLFSPSGRLLAVAGAYPQGLFPVFDKKTWQTISDLQGKDYRLHTLLLHTRKHRDWGYLQVGQSLEDYEDFLTRAKKVLAVGLPISLLLIGGASWWLASLAMRPIYQSYKQMEQFCADVAHELRTPLTTVQTTVESALLLPKLESKKALSVLRTVENQNRRLIQLVVDLLLLASTNKRSIPLHREPCCLNDLIQDLVEELLSLAIAARVTLNCELRVNNPLYVLGDCDQLYRLVANLIVNAIQHTPANGKVTVILKRNHDYALIQVWDTGVGIAPQHQKHIFDRFYRVESDRSRNTGGSGLGLAIAQAIARSHHASLTVKSELGKGSIFIVQLPLVKSKKTA